MFIQFIPCFHVVFFTLSVGFPWFSIPTCATCATKASMPGLPGRAHGCSRSWRRTWRTCARGDEPAGQLGRGPGDTSHWSIFSVIDIHWYSLIKMFNGLFHGQLMSIICSNFIEVGEVWNSWGKSESLKSLHFPHRFSMDFRSLPWPWLGTWLFSIQDGGTRLVPGFHRSFMAWLEALGLRLGVLMEFGGGNGGFHWVFTWSMFPKVKMISNPSLWVEHGLSFANR